MRRAIGFFSDQVPRYLRVINDGNTAAWYIADDLTTVIKDGSNYVSRWNDKLGSGHDLIQETGTRQPLWSTNGVLCDGLDNFMKTIPFVLASPIFIYMVVKQLTWTTQDRFFDGNVAISGMVNQQTAPNGIRIYTINGGSVNNANLALATFGIIRVLFKTGALASKLIVNNTAVTTLNSFIEVNMGGFTLGASPTPSNYGNIQVKEIIIRKIEELAANQIVIYNYFATKYGFATI